MTKQKQLTAAIIKAVPEIMELKFGCEVEYTKTKMPEQLTSCEKSRVIGKVVWVEPVDSKMPYRKVKVGSTTTTTKDIKILGRELTLCDCIRTIDKTDITKCEQYKKENWTMPEFAGHIILKLIDMWKMEKPYSQQSEEVYEFLWGLLVS